MLRFVTAALLLAAGYALGASGVVPDLWRHLSGSSERSVPQPGVPCSSVPGVEYSYERPPPDQLIPAQVVSITDGDTFRALIGNQNVPIRMSDFDAPERDQPYGPEATAALASLLSGGVVQLEVRGSGGFGRTAARVFVGEADVNFEMVRRGAGWFDPEYAKDEELYIVENAARDARIGLWALPLDKRVEPWVWRRLSKDLKAKRR
jgi:endonuclease YncB( thermonuclease family)